MDGKLYNVIAYISEYHTGYKYIKVKAEGEGVGILSCEKRITRSHPRRMWISAVQT